MSKQSNKAVTDPSEQSGDVANNEQAINEQAIGVMAGAYQSYFDGLSNVSAEAYRFMSQRFEEDMRLSTAISQCRDAGEVLELQRAFCTKLVDDYVTEMGRLMALATDSVANDKPSTP